MSATGYFWDSQAVALARARGAEDSAINGLRYKNSLVKILKAASFDGRSCEDVADACEGCGLNALVLASGLTGAAKVAQMCCVTMDEADVRLQHLI